MILNLFIYLFLFLAAVRSSLWHAGSSLQHVGFLLLLLHLMGFSLVVACGFSLSSFGVQAPEHMGSVVCGMRAL